MPMSERSAQSAIGVARSDRLCNVEGMNWARVALAVTAVVVAGMGGWFAVAKWDQANRVATVFSALGAVAAVGVAIWAALRGSSSQTVHSGSVRVGGTGMAKATGAGSNALSGVRSKAGAAGLLKLRDTGDADAAAGGSAVSGIHLD